MSWLDQALMTLRIHGPLSYRGLAALMALPQSRAERLAVAKNCMSELWNAGLAEYGEPERLDLTERGRQRFEELVAEEREWAEVSRRIRIAE